MIDETELAHEVSDDVRAYTIDEALEQGDLSFFLPVQWGLDDEAGDGIGGPSIKDPLTIYASWDVNGADERVTFKTTLRALLQDTYDLNDPLDQKAIELFVQIRRGLLRELLRVDKWIEKARNEL